MKPFCIKKCIFHRFGERWDWYIQVWMADKMFADFKVSSNNDFESESKAKENLENLLTNLEWNDKVKSL